MDEQDMIDTLFEISTKITEMLKPCDILQYAFQRDCGDITMLILVPVNHGPVQSCNLMDTFEEEWWFDRKVSIEANIVVDLDHRQKIE